MGRATVLHRRPLRNPITTSLSTVDEVLAFSEYAQKIDTVSQGRRSGLTRAMEGVVVEAQFPESKLHGPLGVPRLRFICWKQGGEKVWEGETRLRGRTQH